MPSVDTEMLESFHLVPVSTQPVGSNVGKKEGTEINVVEEP